MAYSKYVLKIYPIGMGRDVYRVIEITGDYTLEGLCDCILESFEFDDEHLYEFIIRGCHFTRIPEPTFFYYDDYFDNDDFDENDRLVENVYLDSLGLCKGEKFILHYDYGDDWMFCVSVNKVEANVSDSYDKVIKEKGELEQYPSFDDDDY